MNWYIAKTFVESKSGQVTREVTCEECGSVYYYELARTTMATADAPYGLMQDAAAAKAKIRVEEKLQDLLKTDSEVVPCPQCGLIQQHMIDHARKKMYRGTLVLGFILVVMGLGYVWAGTVLGAGDHRRDQAKDQRMRWMMIVCGTAINIGAILIATRYILIRRLGTRSDTTWLDDAMSGAPPALLPVGEADEQGRYDLEPAPRFQRAQRAGDSWVAFPLLRLHLPEICCECLAPSNTVHRPIKLLQGWGGLERVPMCDVCARRVHLRSWLGVVMAALMISSASVFIATLLPQDGFFKPFLFGAFGSIFGTALAIAYVKRVLAEPYHVKTIDDERGIVRIRFRNPHYARLVRLAVAAQEGEHVPQEHALRT